MTDDFYDRILSYSRSVAYDFNIALNNVLKKKTDYLIYFVTIVLIVALMYSFLSLAFAEDIRFAVENISLFVNGIVFLSIVVALISGFMIDHAISFILIRRKKEIALYKLMGMEEKTICRLFIYVLLPYRFAASI